MCNLIRSLYLIIRRNKTYVDEIEPFIETSDEDYFSDEESYNDHLRKNIQKLNIKNGDKITQTQVNKIESNK